MISKHSPQTQGMKSSMFGLRKSGKRSGGWLFSVSPLLHLSCPALKQPLNALTQFFRSFGLTTLKWILWMGLAFAYLSGIWELINGMYVIIQHHKKQWLLKQFVLVSPYSDTRRLAKIHRRQKIVSWKRTIGFLRKWGTLRPTEEDREIGFRCLRDPC